MEVSLVREGVEAIANNSLSLKHKLYQLGTAANINS